MRIEPIVINNEDTMLKKITIVRKTFLDALINLVNDTTKNIKNWNIGWYYKRISSFQQTIIENGHDETKLLSLIKSMIKFKVLNLLTKTL